MNLRPKALHCAMVAWGLVWPGAVLWLITSNAIAREIRTIGAIAQFLDKLPNPVNTPIFLLLWFCFSAWMVSAANLGSERLNQTTCKVAHYRIFASLAAPLKPCPDAKQRCRGKARASRFLWEPFGTTLRRRGRRSRSHVCRQAGSAPLNIIRGQGARTAGA